MHCNCFDSIVGIWEYSHRHYQHLDMSDYFNIFDQRYCFDLWTVVSMFEQYQAKL